MTTTRILPWPTLTALGMIVLATASDAPPAWAQVSVEPARECADPDRGSLGITGFRCDHCSFTRSRSGFTRAEFLTEPEIFAVDPDATEGDDLAVGDVLVAVDGELITTDAGARRFTSLRAEEWVRLTVRRSGRSRELRIRTARACDVDPPSPEPLPGMDAPPLPAEPRPGASPATPMDPLPSTRPPRAPLPAVSDPSRASLPLAPPAPSPGASLGFGIECGPCTYRSEADGERGAWSFEEPPRVYQVREGGSAWSAGLRPGDVLEALDGVPLTTPEGGRRFARLEPGRTVVWTVRRGSRRLEVVTLPELRTQPSPGATPSGAATGPLRYTGRVGDAEVVVRGGAVNVREDREAGVLIIHTGDVVVTIRRGPEDPGG